MTEKHTRGETHGCIVCGNLYQMYVIYDAAGKFLDARVMSRGGKLVRHEQRPLVACDRHSPDEIKSAVDRVYGERDEDPD